MPTSNVKVGAALDEIADLLEIEQANPFRIRAYRNAARTVRDLTSDVAAMVKRGADLTDLPGIGQDLAGKIADLALHDTTEILRKLRREVPPALTALLQIPGLGPKRVKALHDELDIHSIAQLHRALKDGRIDQLPGFGPMLKKRLLESVEARAKAPPRFKLSIVAPFAEELVAYLKGASDAIDVVAAGSLRRAKETVGDVDILVTAKTSAGVVARFVGFPDVKKVLAKGGTRATVVLKSGLQVDLRVVDEESFGSALQYFTGSKAHNIAIRGRGVGRGLKINEYGVFRGARRIAGETEESVYRAVGLPFIAPELRENRGEIEAAEKGRLPRLIEFKDLRGDLHAHTTATDGRNSLADMVAAARKFGFAYLAITEHSRRITMAHGLDEKRLLKQCDAIDKLNAANPGIAVLKGIEVDILEDGALDLPDRALKHLDLVIGAVHSRFNLPRAKQTERILRAMDRPFFSILAHPSGRLIPEREPYDVDVPRIIRHARERGCFLELNAHPERLDLLDVHCQAAKEEGVLISINSDAHSVLDFNNLRFGVGQARRGWLEKRDVLNARPLAELRGLLVRTMARN
jgi:DNA polymerase (family 10)